MRLPTRVKLLSTCGLSADSVVTVALSHLLGFRDLWRQSARGIIHRKNNHGNSEREGGKNRERKGGEEGEREKRERETDTEKEKE